MWYGSTSTLSVRPAAWDTTHSTAIDRFGDGVLPGNLAPRTGSGRGRMT